MGLSELKTGFTKLSLKMGYKQCIALAAAAGLLLVGVSGLFDNGGGGKAADENAAIADYRCAEEQRLRKILTQIEGVGNAHVMITLENGVEYRYASDSKRSGDSVFTYASDGDRPTRVQETENTEQSYILIGSSGDRRPLVITELSPKVKGVVVVCRGGGDAVVRQRVTEAVTTALGINSLQVCVIQSSK